jgi:hypothetical protein
MFQFEFGAAELSLEKFRNALNRLKCATKYESKTGRLTSLGKSNHDRWRQGLPAVRNSNVLLSLTGVRLAVVTSIVNHRRAVVQAAKHCFSMVLMRFIIVSLAQF